MVERIGIIKLKEPENYELVANFVIPFIPHEKLDLMLRFMDDLSILITKVLELIHCENFTTFNCLIAFSLLNQCSLAWI